jgi:hypothetical protein
MPFNSQISCFDDFAPRKIKLLLQIFIITNSFNEAQSPFIPICSKGYNKNYLHICSIDVALDYTLPLIYENALVLFET